MVSIRRFLMAGMATLLLAGACTSINAPAIPTIPAINIPSIPPINLPSIPPINLPSIPPINLPSIPPINLPSINIPNFSFPPIVLPSGDPTAGLCPLVSPAEMAQILGQQVSVASDSADNCTYTLPDFTAVTVSQTSDSDLTGVKFLMGNSAQAQTFGNYQGIAGTALGQPAAYLQGNGKQLGILWVLGGNDPNAVQKMIQVAQLAATRWQ